jgi:hypothetical protein
MEQVGPIEQGDPTLHLARDGQHAECKPYTQEDLISVRVSTRVPGFGNALTARLLGAHIKPGDLCTECFPEAFLTNYAQVVRAT